MRKLDVLMKRGVKMESMRVRSEEEVEGEK
jgi:hypothetical protein